MDIKYFEISHTFDISKLNNYKYLTNIKFVYICLVVRFKILILLLVVYVYLLTCVFINGPWHRKCNSSSYYLLDLETLNTLKYIKQYKITYFNIHSTYVILLLWICWRYIFNQPMWVIMIWSKHWTFTSAWENI